MASRPTSLSTAPTRGRITPVPVDNDVPTQKKSTYDDLLVAVGRTKDKDAFVSLFDHFAPRIKAFLMRGGLPESEAEELAQETMLMVWQKADTFDPMRATASTWIYTVARNKKIDRLRKNRFVMLDLDDLAASGNEIAAPSDDTEFMHGAMMGRLESAIQDLPPEQAELVHKAFFEDMSHAEIASKTKIPLGTVKSRLRMGLARLRKTLFPGDDTVTFSDI